MRAGGALLAHTDFSLQRKVVAEARLEHASEFSHALSCGLRYQSIDIGGQIEDERGVASHCLQIHLEEPFG